MPADGPVLFSVAAVDSRVVSSAGRTEQTITVVIVAARAKRMMRQLGVSSMAIGSDRDVIMATRTFPLHKAKRMPTLDAIADATSDSVKSWRTIRARLAPMASRTAISR